MLDSWHLFLMAHTRERRTDKNKRERDVFGVQWEFVDTWLSHVEVEDAEQILRDLVDLQHGLNAS